MSIFGSLKRFIQECKKYATYTRVYTNALGTAEVSNTSLGYIWWFLDPVLNMVIYVTLVRLVFQQRDENYIVFFFSAMLVWRYFSVALQRATSSIRQSLGLCREIYVPKFIFPFAACWTGLMPLLFSLLFLIFVLMPFTHVAWSWTLLYLPFLIIALFWTTYILSLITAQINIMLDDFSTILQHLLMIGMFVTPVFYSIDRVPEQYQFLMKLNPVGIITTSFRAVILHGQAPPLKRVIYLIIIMSFLGLISVHQLYKHDKMYNKINSR